MRTTKRFFDLEEVRSLPIKEVCASFGIPVERGDFIKLRPDENTASTKLYLNKGTGHDRFYDFGSHIGGDCIQLIQEYRGCSWQDALEDVADAFGIQPVNNFEYAQRGVLTDHQWRKLGVYGEMVSKNLDFDLERFSVESAQKYADKYRMPVNVLREKDPKFYIAAILRNRAFPHVYNLRNYYYMQIYSEQALQIDVAGRADRNFLTEERKNELNRTVQELESVEKLLKMALRGTDVRFTFRGYNLEKDWDDILQAKISFEIGPQNNYDVKKYAQKHGCGLLYATISDSDYFTRASSESEVPHAAFIRGNSVKLVYASDAADQIEEMFGISRVTPEKAAMQEEKVVAERAEAERARPQAEEKAKATADVEQYAGDEEVKGYDKDGNVVATWFEPLGGLDEYDPRRKQIVKIVIPDAVEEIGRGSFQMMENLTSVVFGKDSRLTTLGDGAFVGTSLTSITIPNCVVSISNNAFRGCTSLENITIPAGVTNVGDHAFYGCPELTEINVSPDNTAFESIDGVLYSKDRTRLVCYPANKSGESFTVPDDVVFIKDHAFTDAELARVEIPAGVKEIGAYAFEGCTYLKTITFGTDSELSTIGEYAFWNCGSLTSIEIPEGVMDIGSHAFKGCTNLISVEIPDSVKTIGEKAFYSCTNLANISFGENSRLEKVGENAFSGCDKLNLANSSDNRSDRNNSDCHKEKEPLESRIVRAEEKKQMPGSGKQSIGREEVL